MTRITASVVMMLLAGVAPVHADIPPGEPPEGALLRRRDKPTPAPPCQVELRLQQLVRPSGVLLEATLRNRTRKRLRFRIASHCPADPIVLRGLPANLDPFHTCNRGPCLDPQPVVVDLPPRGTQRIARARIAFDGDECSAPLPEEAYQVAFSVEPVDDRPPVLCEAPPISVARPVRVASPQPARPTPPTKPSRCPNIPCGIGCPNGMGMAHDANGCTLCACERSPMDALKPGRE